MYPPKHYGTAPTEQAEYDQLITIIERNPLATLLVNINEDLPHISHIPFHLDSTQTALVGHTSNHHPLAKILQKNHTTDVAIIFHGPEGYISPSDSSGQPVPTWNYCKVHIKGTVTAITETHDKYQQMTATTKIFEQGQSQPWLLPLEPSTAITHMLKAITIFTLAITEISGNLKLSQNKSISVKQQIATQLTLRGNQKLAEQMTGG